MNTKKKFALKSFAIFGLIAMSLIGLSLATGLLKVDLVASSIANELPENYFKLEDKVSNKLNEGKNLIFFTSNWCGPCQVMSNTYKSAAEKYSEINFYEADIELNRDLANNMNALNAPVVLFVQDGTVVGNSEVNINEIEKVVDRFASL
jgi:thioredoxin 1